MNTTLLNRLQALGSLLVCIAYFLPWASVLSPLGSFEIRGLYVDFAWAVLISAILHLLVQFARLNKAALGLPDEFSKGIDILWLGLPFVFVAFFAWYGAGFIFRSVANGSRATFFGVAIESTISAGLDYGFWIGTFGALLAIIGVGLISQRIKTIAAYGAVVVVIASALAFGLSLEDRGTEPQTAQQTPSSALSSNLATPGVVSEPSLDASPYVTVTKITGTQLLKDPAANRFSDSIMISLGFKNIGKKTIVGLQGHISVLDGFGAEVYGFNFRADDRIAPGESSESDYNFDGNQFEDDDPYHKMLPVIGGGTVKYKSKIVHIAFDDGTVLPK